MPAETHVAVLTPAGRGAVATVAVRGPAAVALVQPHFEAASQRPLSDAPPGRIQFGRFQSAAGHAEEIVAVVVGPENVELHCHGGPAAADAIVATLAAVGARPVSWQQWLAAAEDPWHAECRQALAAATSERTCAILLDQYRGALASELAAIDGLPDAEARQRLERLLALSRTVGAHLTTPWRIVLAGEPNVGKSSLINAILGYERSIVFDQPGTTRDALTATTAIDGWPIELVDTAGLRAAADGLEAAGIQRTKEVLDHTDLVLWVTDVTAPAAPPAALLPERSLLVGNKVDLLSPSHRQAWQQRHPAGILVSALTGDGIDDLCRRLSRTLVPRPPAAGEAVPFTSGQRALIQTRAATRLSERGA